MCKYLINYSWKMKPDKVAQVTRTVAKYKKHTWLNFRSLNVPRFLEWSLCMLVFRHVQKCHDGWDDNPILDLREQILWARCYAKVQGGNFVRKH